MKYDPDDYRITAFAFGELEGQDLVDFEQELSQSEPLRQHVDEMRRMIVVIRDELRQEPQLALSAAQRTVVEQAIAGHAVGNTPTDTAVKGPAVELSRSTDFRRGWRILLSVAAAACLVGLLSVYWLRSDLSVASRMDSPGRAMAPSESSPRAPRAASAVEPGIRVLEERSRFSTGAASQENVHGFGEVRGQAMDALTATVGEPDMEGADPGLSMLGGSFAPILENEFRAVNVAGQERSTFAIDVDTASYAKVRQFLARGVMPPADAIRIEELLNYFPYDYVPPVGEEADPFASHLEVAECPWNPRHRLVRIALKGRVIEQEARPASNLIFLLDVSGSMNQPNKLPLLKSAMQMLLMQLTENDIVSIVVYAGSSGLVLPPTSGDRQSVIQEALEVLEAGGSTNGGEGIELAYRIAIENFIEGGVNRVILCTDGDFNVGLSDTESLSAMAEEKAKSGVFLSVLAFGMDNHNDAMLESISNKGNGNYAFVDTLREARKVLIEQMSGTLVTIAKDVKLQVEFNPAQVAAYRLIGYENRVMANQDFRDDAKDAGEIGAGHCVTAMYEIIPMENGLQRQLDQNAIGEEDQPLRYQSQGAFTEAGRNGEALTLFVRYKQPDGDVARELSSPLNDQGSRFGQSSQDFRFAAAVAAFGMMLRSSQYRGDITWDAIEEIAQASASPDPNGYRAEFLTLVRQAKDLAK